ncbi:zinc finger domain-containing protein [Rhodovulum sulfidophilum]|uniref:zinc finger domain-containing protein n=1 Tax=Rhodovulum sulfidophilum TaxID=35806 RepID=UPI00117A39C9|nr:hypothetical protein [Rhodovulum sulfidophilum]MBL3554399.1 hypothetical protein [Rhodovulum sulfidophilum]
MTEKSEPKRRAVRSICPRCGAEPGQPCLGKRGQSRTSYHKERLEQTAKADRVAELMNKLDIPEVDGFVVYGIRNPDTETFVYIGQTGRFRKRVRDHLRSGLKPHRFPPVKKWLYETLGSGRVPVFEVLQHCVSEQASLDAETALIRKLTAEGMILLNNWKIHRE